jgi:hypothetical protein
MKQTWRWLFFNAVDAIYTLTMVWQLFIVSDKPDPIADWIRKGKENVCN